MSKKTATKKNTPTNCKFPTCHYNQLPPPENSQECVACEGNSKNWRPLDNPATSITLHFRDGSALEFALERPVFHPYRELMKQVCPKCKFFKGVEGPGGRDTLGGGMTTNTVWEVKNELVKIVPLCITLEDGWEPFAVTGNEEYGYCTMVPPCQWQTRDMAQKKEGT